MNTATVLSVPAAHVSGQARRFSVQAGMFSAVVASISAKMVKEMIAAC